MKKEKRIETDISLKGCFPPIPTPFDSRRKVDHDHPALGAHYTTIANHSPIPIILYSIPSSTGIDLTAETIVDLAQNPNAIGIKES